MPTKIEWTNESWNPITGCSKVSPGCANCYAERMAKRLAGKFGYPKDDPFRVTFHEDRLLKPLKWKKPRMIFPCSMSDILHEDIPADWIAQVFNIACDERCEHHIFQFLTKRPQNWQDFINWMNENWAGDNPVSIYLENSEIPPSNIWMGVSAEDQKWFDKRVSLLLQIPAAVRFVSLEPLLGPIDLGLRIYPINYNGLGFRGLCQLKGGINWVIIGCESGPKRRECKLEWVWNIVRQCKAAHVPCFVKQLQINGRVSHDPEEWPEDLRIREYPDVSNLR